MQLKIRMILLIVAVFSGTASLFSQNRYLMVVDVQSQFYSDPALKEGADEMLKNINLLIGQTHPDKVIYVLGTGKVLSISLKGIKVLPMTTTPEADSALKIVNDQFFTKTEGDCFTLDSLNAFLAAREVKDILLVGLMAEECIFNTAIGGKIRGYNITVIPEALLSRSETKKGRALQKMEKKGVGILTLDQIMKEKQN
ncbi:MAG: isochorismatase family protein [Bacteroidota bacterium]